MIDHLDFAVRDPAKSRAFYVAALAPLGLVVIADIDHQDGRTGTGFGANGIGTFFIGGGAPVTGRLHVAFSAGSRAAVDAFHEAAMAVGGTSHGAPGLRPRYGGHYYAAYVRDLDGHVVEAVFRG